MGEFSRQTRQTVETFASSMQFARMPKPAKDGSYNFVFEQMGTLSLIATEDGKYVLMALGRKQRINDNGRMKRFFAGAGLDPTTNAALHAGIAPDGAYYYVTRIPSDRFDLPTLEETLNWLNAAHEGV
jgi:hypothetical protein